MFALGPGLFDGVQVGRGSIRIGGRGDKEDEFFRIDREDALVELGATDMAGFSISFDGVERLFSAADPAGEPTGAPP